MNDFEPYIYWDVKFLYGTTRNPVAYTVNNGNSNNIMVEFC